MKKIFSILVLSILIFALSGCNLAVEDEYYDYTDNLSNEKNTEDYYIPSGIEFSLYKGFGLELEIDVSEYFYVSFNCPNQTIFDNCTSTNIGKSIESAGMKMHFDASTINGVDQPTIITTTIDLTFYALKDNDLSIFSTILFENEFGDIKREAQTGTDFASGLTISGKVEGMREDGSIYILDYTFHYETIDELELVKIKQFDEVDNLIVETNITSLDLLDELILHEDTAYYFIIEDYVDSEGDRYQERIYNESTSTLYYLYKYTNDDGFLNGDRLIINTFDSE